MRVFQEKRRWRRFLFSRYSLGVLCLAAILLLFASGRAALRAYRVSQERREAEAKYRELEAEKARLEERIASLQAPAGLEKEAKKRFGAKSPGEEVLVIVESPPIAPPSP
ncbi:septum formation initiator family protein, partial [Candidatus Giovannonibacteria bacterium]|nr:septum formation initiator family protein [Candidatus Giovannonibacteria bacterium]